MKEHFQVVVVGGGPVGVALMVEMSQRGVSCALVERGTELQDIPKGQLLTGRTVEHFHFWNCLQQLRAARVLPAGHQIGTITAYGNLLSGYSYNGSVAAAAAPELFFRRVNVCRSTRPRACCASASRSSRGRPRCTE